MKETYTTPENREWKLARRTAFVQDILASFTRRPADLMSFEHVQQKLQLRDVHYLGLQGVPLAQIVGSVGRYTDFNRFFFPRKDNLRGRWRIDWRAGDGRSGQHRARRRHCIRRLRPSRFGFRRRHGCRRGWHRRLGLLRRHGGR